MTDPFARPLRRRDLAARPCGRRARPQRARSTRGLRREPNQGASTQATQKVDKAVPDGDLVYFN
jgi:hypothetical protein